MKIVDLHLKSFGPFTGKVLDFSQTGFHLVYGPNEAGKSSALRAVSNFLYGIPARSTDNFLHDNKTLRIAATLQCADGQTQFFVRRKGNRDTLLDGDENPCADTAIDPFLGRVKKELFLNMFGLSHQRLIKGGNEILSGEGDVGESIFAAGLGVVGLRQLLEELEGKEKELFRPGGQNQKINQLISDFAKTKQELRALSLSAKDFKEVAADLQAAERERDSLTIRLSELVNEIAKWERLQKAAPKVVKFDSLQTEREALGDVAILPDDFAQRRAENQRDRVATEEEMAALEGELSELQKEIDSTRVNERVLERESEILALFQRQGSYVKSQQDLPTLRHRRHNMREEAQRLLRSLGLSDDLAEAEKLRLTVPQRLQITAAIDELKTFRRKISEAEEQIREGQEGIAEMRVTLAALRPSSATDSLQAVLKVATGDGNLHRRLQEISQEREILEGKAAARLKRLLPPVAQGLAELESLPVPSAETIKRFEYEGSTLDQQENLLTGKLREAEAQQQKLLLQIDAVKKGDEIPSEEDLAQARSRRDHGWSLVRRSWEGETVAKAEIIAFAADEDLAKTYEGFVVRADNTADLLRRESGRVAQLRQLDAEQRRLDEQMGAHRQGLADVATEREKWEKQWVQVWKPSKVNPLTPTEMLSWRGNYEKLMETGGTIRELRGKQGGMETRIEELRQRFRQEGKQGGHAVLQQDLSLDELIVHAEDTVSSIQTQNQERQEVERELSAATRQLQKDQVALCQLEKEEQTAKENWGATVAVIGLKVTATPDEAQAILAGIGEVTQKLDDVVGLSGRIIGIEKDCKSFEELVESLLQQLNMSANGDDPQKVVHRLHAQLTESQTNLAALKNLRKQADEKKKRRNAAEVRSSTLKAALDRLLQEAGVGNEADFQLVESASKKARSLDEMMVTLREQLVDFSSGGAVEALMASVREINADTIPGKIQQHRSDEAELQTQLTALNEQVGGRRRDLSALDGSEAAALKAEEMEGTLAALRTKIEEYTRVRLASILLRREIDRYRQQNQGPVLRCAGDYFEKLTLGSFSRLGTDFNDKDEQILVGLRTDGTRVTVDAMSDGTCDQLYLALRLASLKHHIESNEPMPLILDDILVNFDDERSGATLEILAELSQKNQIIYFTHHRHIVEIARAMPGASSMSFHTLNHKEPATDADDGGSFCNTEAKLEADLASETTLSSSGSLQK